MSFGSILYSLLLKPLQLLFEVIYVFAYNILGNPGLTIIVLSIVINFLVLPLYKRADAMQEEERDTEAKLHKGVSHIKKTFRGDEKMMILQTYYRQNGYKPTYVLRSAISLLLEIPFFIAAYKFLSGLELLKGVSFGPIADLGAQDGLILIGNLNINILPIIMTAVNLVTCIIFTKGATPKTKIQLYSMAIFFLFFLYTSPSGLVFYWTLNNIFSLIRTIFYKLKNPGKVLGILFSAIGIILAFVAIFTYKNPSTLKKLFVLGCGIAFQLPLIYQLLKGRFRLSLKNIQYHSNSKTFFAGGVFLSILTGITIPSSVIKSSAQEFLNINHYQNPIWFIVGSFCVAFGAFVIWFGIFYWLAKPTTKELFNIGIWILCGVAVVNYMFFGNKLGTLSSVLSFETNVIFSRKEILINSLIVIAIIVSFYLIFKFFHKHTPKALFVIILALSIMAPMDIISINSQIKDINKTALVAGKTPKFTMHKNGKNVIVFMLDRAMGEYLPYIFNEKPELKEKFAGFTAYTNVISFGGYTNFATPALLGGYEYTPVEINKRSDELLVAKHNEALKVMPVLFDQNNFNVTVFDPVYANYKWIPDLSVFDEYPDIHRYITKGKFNPKTDYYKWFNGNMRNFFCYSIMKISPVVFQKHLYNKGNYYSSNLQSGKQSGKQTNVQTREGLSKSKGLFSTFMAGYNVLDNMSNITKTDDSSENSFLLMTNSLTHDPMMLQLPDYSPSENVDNTEYDAKNKKRFVVNGRTIDMNTEQQVIHYQTNMAAYLKLGEWFDYMRENGVYDNTRIILASDHGRVLKHNKDRILADGTDTELFYPFMMVKDFGETDFSFSNEFMTNADVPTLAAKGIIKNPKNPFTGNSIENSLKSEHPQYIFSSSKWNVNDNNGKTFLPGNWYRVSNGNMQDVNNWTKVGTNTTLPDTN